jgi:hypothetical protein
VKLALVEAPKPIAAQVLVWEPQQVGETVLVATQAQRPLEQ